MELARRQRGPGQAEEEDVLEDAAAQGDPRNAGPLTEPVRRVGNEVGHRDMEAGRHRPDRTPVPRVIDDGPQHRRRIDLAMVDREVVHPSLVDVGRGNPLQLHRGLRFVRRSMANPEKGAHCVEKTSHA